MNAQRLSDGTLHVAERGIVGTHRISPDIRM